MLNRKNKKGFTLAELLIVVAIIAVLVAIAVPLFVGALDDAKESTFDANKRSLRSTAVVALLEQKNQTELNKLANDKVLYATGTFKDGVITKITWSESGTDTTWEEYKKTADAEETTITVAIAKTDMTLSGLPATP